METRNQFTRRSFLQASAAVVAGVLAAACQAKIVEKTVVVEKPVEKVVKETVVVKEEVQKEVTKVVEKVVQVTAPPVKKAKIAEVMTWHWAFVGWDKQLELAEKDRSPEFEFCKWIKETFEARGWKLLAEDHGWEEVRTNALLAVAAGNPPDVMVGEGFIHELAALGVFAECPNVKPDDFAWGCIAGGVLNGKVYGVPEYTSSQALEVNTFVAEKLGIDPKPPKTWAELLTNSQKAKEKGQGEEIHGYTVIGPAPTSLYGTMLRVAPITMRAGALLGSDDGLKATLNHPRAATGYQYIRELLKTSNPGISFSADWGQFYGALWNNKALYHMASMFEIAKINGGIAPTYHTPFPVCEDAECAPRNIMLGNLMLSPMKGGKNVEGGVAFCEFLAEEETQWNVARLYGVRMPCRKSVLADPKVGESAGYVKRDVVEFAKVHAAIILQEETHPVPPWNVNADRMWKVWGDAYGEILSKDVPIQPVLDKAQTEAERLLKGANF